MRTSGTATGHRRAAAPIAPRQARPQEVCSCLALREAARHLSRLYDDALAPMALGVNQFSVLAVLAHSGPASLNALARRLVMDRSTLGHLLRPLARRGLVGIGFGADDRRQRLVSLTADGAALFREAHPLWRQAEQGFQLAFGKRRSTALRRLLGIVAQLEIAAKGMPDRAQSGRERELQ